MRSTFWIWVLVFAVETQRVVGVWMIVVMVQCVAELVEGLALSCARWDDDRVLNTVKAYRLKRFQSNESE